MPPAWHGIDGTDMNAGVEVLTGDIAAEPLNSLSLQCDNHIGNDITVGLATCF